MPKKMPKQKPHRSEQTVATPWELVKAIQERFGIKFHLDLAATSNNTKAPFYLDHQVDSLKQNWCREIGPERHAWLNPPYENISLWAEKCHEESKYLSNQSSLVFMLVPVSTGTRWFEKHVHYVAKVIFLSPRVTFEGHAASYPKDLMLCVYGAWKNNLELPLFYTHWRWK